MTDEQIPVHGDAAVIAELAHRSFALGAVDPTVLYAAILNTSDGGQRIAVEDLERLLPAPRRIVQTASLERVQDLLGYLGRHVEKPKDAAVYVERSGRIVAFVDAHDRDTPAWQEHRAEVNLRHSTAWTHWAGGDGTMLSQDDFAEHVEDGLDEIVTPDGATMLELAQTFHATTGGTFRSARRLDSGSVQLQYDEVVEAQAGGSSGTVDVPQEFELALAPFEGEEPYRVRARFRYRLRSGSLTLGYKLVRPADVIEDALDTIAARIADGGWPTLRGRV